MANAESNLTDAEWEAKFNGPRDALLKEIFGDTPCPIKDISPKVAFRDKNWERNEDFMASSKQRILKNMNPNMAGIAEWNEQMRNSGKIVKVISSSELGDLKAKPDPVK